MEEKVATIQELKLAIALLPDQETLNQFQRTIQELEAEKETDLERENRLIEVNKVLRNRLKKCTAIMKELAHEVKHLPDQTIHRLKAEKKKTRSEQLETEGIRSSDVETLENLRNILEQTTKDGDASMKEKDDLKEKHSSIRAEIMDRHEFLESLIQGLERQKQDNNEVTMDLQKKGPSYGETEEEWLKQIDQLQELNNTLNKKRTEHEKEIEQARAEWDRTSSEFKVREKQITRDLERQEAQMVKYQERIAQLEGNKGSKKRDKHERFLVLENYIRRVAPFIPETSKEGIQKVSRVPSL